MTACLDDETVLGLVEGRLAPPQLAQIDEHLDACDSCRDVVTHVAGSQSQVIERGTTLGRYVVGDLVGEGAMGRVYSAWDPELDRRVALKVLQHGTQEARTRLLREAQAMAKLDHPNVVGVFEVGQTAKLVYVTMDLVDGDTLRAWCERKRTWREIARVLADVARGLAAVHAAGVLHRDVKPDNVIVGADGRARIGDFGLARAGATPTVVDGAKIATGSSIAGTPAYMAPEVLRGGAASEASDQFGFGVTAYELLAGRRPFEGRTWAELLAAIERGAVERLRDVPSWMDAMVRRCLAIDPARRFPSMTAIGSLIERGVQVRRPLWIAAAAAAVLASGATYFAVRGETVVRSSCDDRQQLDVAYPADPSARAATERWVDDWATARSFVCRAAENAPAAVIATRERCLESRRSELYALLERTAETGSTERLVDALAASLPPSECITLLDSADPKPLDPQKATLITAIEGELPKVRAAIALGDARPVEKLIDTLVGHARQSGHAPTLGEVLLLRAQAARALSKLPDAAIAARDAAAAAERGRDDLGAARAWVERVVIAGDRRDMAATDDLAALADAAIDRAGSPPHLVANLLRVRGLVAFNRGQLAEAKDLLVQARTQLVAIAGERSVEVAGIETSLGAVARAAGELDEAERHHRLAFEIDRELRGENHPDLARDLHNLAGIARLRNKLDEALALYRQALAIENATRGEASIQSALTHNSIGLVHMSRGEWRAALTEVAFARDTFHAAGHGDEAFTEHNLGIIRLQLGETAEALRHLDRAAALYTATIGSDAVSPIRLHVDRARARLTAGDAAGARADATLARGLAQRAQIEWIVQDADAILRRVPSPRTPAPVEIEPRKPDPPPPPPPPPPRKEPPKQPIKDVGVYGSSQGW